MPLRAKSLLAAKIEPVRDDTLIFTRLLVAVVPDLAVRATINPMMIELETRVAN